MRNAFLFSALFVLTSCSTTRTVHFKYDVVSRVLKDRFVKNYDEFKQSKPKVTERVGGLTLYFESPVNFFYGVNVTLGAKRSEDDNQTVLSAWIIEDHRTFWGATGRNQSMEKELLGIVEQRLKDGKWQRMPWRPIKKIVNRTKGKREQLNSRKKGEGM